MQYLCTNCNFIYDEMTGEPEDGIPAWVKLSSLEWHITCPNCNESGDYFQEITQHVHSLDEEHLLPFELEHIPKIEQLDDGYIKIESNHPNEAEHFIGNIWIYDEYWDLFHEEFFKPWTWVYLEVDVSDLDEYEVRMQCSLHGVFGKKVDRM